MPTGPIMAEKKADFEYLRQRVEARLDSDFGRWTSKESLQRPRHRCRVKQRRLVTRTAGWGSMMSSSGCRTQQPQCLLLSRLCSSAHVRHTKPAIKLQKGCAHLMRSNDSRSQSSVLPTCSAQGVKRHPLRASPPSLVPATAAALPHCKRTV